MKWNRLLLLLIPTVIVGCKSVPPEQLPQSQGKAEAQLVETAMTVHHSLINLEAQEQAAFRPKQYFQPPPPATYDMAGIASVDWSGPIEPLLQKIAESTGFKVKIMGVEPAVPVIVTIYARNVQMADIVRDIGYQTGTRADLVLYPRDKTMELRYAPA